MSPVARGFMMHMVMSDKQANYAAGLVNATAMAHQRPYVDVILGCMQHAEAEITLNL